MTDTIDIEADDEIDTLTTLMEAKTGNHVLPAEAIREAVAYWLANHEVAECDSDDGVVTPAAPEPQTVIRHRDIEIDSPSPVFDEPIRGDDGTIPKR